ncbi:uncharacterized protein LOC131686843 [Topomyia yanbarensis]|uniref:uncharacterized protein LOC131686843 n=1 Tax=Topomyia yanbarensis TaxID=2498891 RepID=UPI00273A7B97|nr:uncharacterized protein LOC131686843 [Topomyia yanbarensis]
MSSVDPLSNKCRCCLKENKSNSYSVFATLEEFESKICDLIANCCGITIKENDDYPKFICRKCFYELVKATRFRVRCIQSESVLHKEQSQLSNSSTGSISCEQAISSLPQDDMLAMEPELLIQVKEEPIDFQLQYDPLSEEAQRNESNAPKVAATNNVQPAVLFDPAQLLVPCELCSRKFATRANLLTHMRFHPKLPCLICDEEFESQANLTKHQEEKHPSEAVALPSVPFKNEILTYPCDVCGKVFPSKKQLSNHKPRHLSESLKKCSICDKKFIMESRYLRHMKQHERGKVDQCQTCGRIFHCRKKFTRHKCKRPLNQCLICLEIFTDTLNLTRHRRLHDAERKSYKCDQCDRTFIEKRNLTIHQRYHSNEDIPTCDICGKRFLHITRLQKHMPIHNEPDNTPGKCILCDKEFLRQSELKRHIRWHNGELPHECTICGKLYRERRHLLTHQRKHTGEKPFQCDRCDKAFCSRDVLRQHKALHDRPVKTHQCTICGNTFTAVNYLRFHMKKHTNDEQKTTQSAEQTADQLLNTVPLLRTPLPENASARSKRVARKEQCALVAELLDYHDTTKRSPALVGIAAAMEKRVSELLQNQLGNDESAISAQKANNSNERADEIFVPVLHSTLLSSDDNTSKVEHLVCIDGISATEADNGNINIASGSLFKQSYEGIERNQSHKCRAEEITKVAYDRRVAFSGKRTSTSNPTAEITGVKKKVVWTSEEIAMAFSLRYHSQPGYEIVRKDFKIPLPCLRSLREWASCVNMRRGVLTDVLTLLGIAGKHMSQRERVVVLGFDEMSVNATVEHDKRNDDILGPHKELQVVSARGLFAKWKQPIFADFDRQMSKVILDDLISRLYAIGFTVVANVHDCGGGNMAIWKEITEKDDYPKFICGKCYCELVEATRFRNRCIQSQSILHEKQSSTVSSQINDELDMETEWLVEIEDDQKDVLDLETEWVNEVKEEPIDFQLEFDPLAEEAQRNESNDPKVKSINIQPTARFNLARLLVPCLLCSKKFATRANLLTHMRFHPKKKCLMCDEAFISLAELARHQREKHPPEEAQDVNVVMASGSKNEILTYPCEVCGKVFTSKLQLSNHKPRHKSSIKYPLNLIRHRRQHDPERKSHKCEQCGKTFIEERNLAIHQRYHSDEDMPTCKICGKRFLHITRLRKHMPIHNEPDNTPGKCTLCDKEFLRQSELKRHMRWHSGELPHECTTCGKLYRERRDLLMHERKHTGDMPFKCDICDKTYASPDVFRQHKAFHNRPVKTHQCTICDITFSAANYLKFHMKKHINEEQKKIRNAEGTTDQLLIQMKNQQPPLPLLERRFADRVIPLNARLPTCRQEVWRSGVQWDDPISEFSFEKWKRWLQVLPRVEQVTVPRCHRIRTSSSANYEVQLHTFVDATDLPPARLAAFSRPFTSVGIDYFEPMEVVIGSRVEKRWGMLATCLTIRAIHIELVHSLSTDSCIMALRNFIAHRGSPRMIYSDRGTNFVGASRKLRNAESAIDQQAIMAEFVSSETKWLFNPPASPHMGGSWERLIRTVKKNLAAISLTKKPTDEVLRSLLTEIENVVNSRPLTHVPIDDESPALPTMITRRMKWFIHTKPVCVGDVVVIVDPIFPRNCWPKGKIIETCNSRDGQPLYGRRMALFNIKAILVILKIYQVVLHSNNQKILLCCMVEMGSSETLMLDHCRCCLIKNNSNVYCVFGVLAEFESKICELIANCTGVTITEDDPFPKNICANCFTELVKSTRYRIRCTRTQDILRNKQIGSSTNILSADKIPKTLPGPVEEIIFEQVLETLGEPTKVELRTFPLPVETSSGNRKKVKRKSKSAAAIDPKQMPFACQECGRGFSSRAAVSSHMRVHPKVTCDICWAEFQGDAQLATHRALHPQAQEVKSSNEVTDGDGGPPPERKHLCKICGEGFTSFELLTDHKRIHTKEALKKCEFCGKKFITLHRFLLHMSTHADGKVEQCKGCGKTFHSKGKLSRHQCRRPSKLPNQCLTCMEVFPDEIGLRRHRSIHVVERAFKCEYCGKAFIKNSTLKFHMRYHTGEKVYPCEICGKRFLHMHRLQMHIQAHNDPNNTVFKCSICGREFSRQTELNRHTRWHNGELPHECTACGKFFREHRQLLKHERTHTGEKPYQCDICNKAFHRSNILIQHRARHAKPVQTYECGICGNVFARANYLAFHMVKHKGKPEGTTNDVGDTGGNQPVDKNQPTGGKDVH